jgi:hypothetical protein
LRKTGKTAPKLERTLCMSPKESPDRPSISFAMSLFLPPLIFSAS